VSGDRPSTSAAGGWQQAVAAGLTSLGWSAREADAAVGAIDPAQVAAATTADGGTDVAALLKTALRGLDRS
jgi:Holliday junction DNA helicase RuvA